MKKKKKKKYENKTCRPRFSGQKVATVEYVE